VCQVMTQTIVVMIVERNFREKIELGLLNIIHIVNIKMNKNGIFIMKD